MAIVFLPGQLASRAELYHQARALTVAGVPLVKALEMLKKSPPSYGDRKPIGTVLESIQLGSTFIDGLRQTRGWLAPFDLSLIEAGERSGRLDQCFHILEKVYNQRAVLARKVLSGLWYPALVFHMAVFIFPLPAFLRPEGAITADQYLIQALTPLVCAYALIIALVLAGQSRWGQLWRALLEKACRWSPVTYLVVAGGLFLLSTVVPGADGWFWNWLFVGPAVAWLLYLAGQAWKHLALARLAMSIEAMLSAGVNLVHSWEMGSKAAGSPALGRAVEKWLPRVSQGDESPGEVLPDCSEIPEMFANLYHTGEISGQLDDTLVRLQDYHQEEGTRKMEAVAEWTPRVVYAFIALMIIKMIFALAGGYMNTIGNIINEK
ncbi:MAG: hypothetical protein FJ386_04625 [Verrucomicrobia bacterium]|nr:hypothetical protein [Verrucomicrobiota bacterium]